MAWIAANQSLLTWVAAASAIVFVVSLLSLPWLVARIPQDYFHFNKRHPTRWKQTHPLIRGLYLVGKNLLGLVLLIGGLLMIFLPGQGLLTMAMGLLLLDYPGKFALERRIVRVPAVLNSINWLRAKAGTPPLDVAGD
ncbi:MAG: PGPGW domain-containing protein [Porticoccaceae bacterium]